MKRFRISINNLASIKALQNDLLAYQNSLPRRVEEICRRLAQRGVSIASQNVSGRFGALIRFSIETNPTTGQTAEMYLVGEDRGVIISWWENQYGEQHKDISPILMAEFGSGAKAENPLNVDGVGRGSYGEHGNQPIWYWKEIGSDDWHRSSGITPTQPMFKARNEMVQIAVDVIREVFEQ